MWTHLCQGDSCTEHRAAAPVQRELLQVGEVAGDVLQGGVRDPRAPGHVQAHLVQVSVGGEEATHQLPQVLRDQLDAVVGDLGAAGEGEDGEVWQGVHWGGGEDGG